MYLCTKLLNGIKTFFYFKNIVQLLFNIASVPAPTQSINGNPVC